MNTEQEQLPSEETAPPVKAQSPTKKRRLGGWQATLVALVGLLAVTVGVEAWFLHDLRQNVIALREGLPTVSTAPTWGENEGNDSTAVETIRPFEEMRRMQEAMNRTFNHSLAWFGNHPLTDLVAEAPKVDIREEPNEFIVKADVPGATEGSVKVDLNGQELTIQGNRESQAEQKDADGRVVREEREAGVFSRSVMLPGPVASSGMKSQLQDGVLTITIPKLSKG